MFTRIVSLQTVAVITTAFCLSAGCGQLKMPRLTDAPSPQPTIPASVTLIFSDSIRTATLEHTVCANTLWTGQLGDSIIKNFQETGQARFARLTVGEEPARAVPASSTATAAFTASINLAHKSFKSRTRTGSDDNFISQLDLQLVATFKDVQGKQLADAPLIYSEQVKIYTPQFGGSGQCATQSLDEIMNTAAEHLAVQFTGYVADLTNKVQGKSSANRQVTQALPPSGTSSALALRATLLDENNNLLLEPGEKVGVRIDVTNTGTAPSGAATVALTGTPALVGAFSETLVSPVQVAALQAGETTSAMLWGRLPATLSDSRGELTVTVTPSGPADAASANQTLVAKLDSRGGSPPPIMPSPALRSTPSTSGGGQDQDRYAVIVGLSLYRSPWPGWREGLAIDTKKTVSLFANGLNVPVGHTLLLQDELAAQEDIEEALASWLPKQVNKNSIVFFYFSGQALADAKTGEVFLIPYDSTPASSRTRLISLRFLQSRLQRLGAKVTLSLIDSPLYQGAASKDTKTKPAAPNWLGDLGGSSDPKAGTLVQVARLTEASSNQQDLLQGLTGPADLDRDGVVTVGEWLRSLRGSAVTAPTLPPTLAVQSIPLTHTNHR